MPIKKKCQWWLLLVEECIEYDSIPLTCHYTDDSQKAETVTLSAVELS